MSDLAVLLSPAAGDRLEDLAAAAARASVQRFGRVVRLFAPLYLSNECVSVCTYCGFSAGNDIARRTLTVDEVVAEGRELVPGASATCCWWPASTPGSCRRTTWSTACGRWRRWCRRSRSRCRCGTATYRRLVAAGCEGLVVYQEAYDRSSTRRAI